MSLGSLVDFKGKSVKDLFGEVVDRGLCTACGTCAGVCPKGCIVFEGEEPAPGDVLRARAIENCNECGICYACCPGEHVEMEALEKKFLGATKIVHQQLLGLYLDRYTATAADEGICLSGASAGTAAALQVFALEEGIIDAVLGVETLANPDVVVKSQTDSEAELFYLFERKAGYFKETENDAVMEKVDDKGNVIGFSILRVSALKEQKPLSIELKRHVA
jgi:NAD-dependent dihydropyrimidine dehydrogenase PreA subunit/uncharacterized protein YuzE